MRTQSKVGSRTQFTRDELNQLMAAFCRIKTADDSCLGKFHAIFDACDDSALLQLSNADIKWVSALAINACVRRGIRTAWEDLPKVPTSNPEVAQS